MTVECLLLVDTPQSVHTLPQALSKTVLDTFPDVPRDNWEDTGKFCQTTLLRTLTMD